MLGSSRSDVRQTHVEPDADGHPCVAFTIRLQNIKSGIDPKPKDGVHRISYVLMLALRSDGRWIQYLSARQVLI